MELSGASRRPSPLSRGVWVSSTQGGNSKPSRYPAGIPLSRDEAEGWDRPFARLQMLVFLRADKPLSQTSCQPGSQGLQGPARGAGKPARRMWEVVSLPGPSRGATGSTAPRVGRALRVQRRAHIRPRSTHAGCAFATVHGADSLCTTGERPRKTQRCVKLNPRNSVERMGGWCQSNDRQR